MTIMFSLNFIKISNFVLKPISSSKIKHAQVFQRNLRGSKNRVIVDSPGYAKYEDVLKQHFNEQVQDKVNNENKVENVINMHQQNPALVETPLTSSLMDVGKIITSANQFDLLSDKVTPYHRMNYEKQLKKKYGANIQVLQKIGMKLKICGADITLGSDKLPCVLDQIVPSPVIEAYRNKDEFSIRTGVDDDPKTVGFFLDSPAENPDTICVGPEDLSIIKGSHKMFAHLFQSYIRMSSLAACHNFKDGGNWRNLIVRSNKEGDVMGIVIIHPQELTEEQLNTEKKLLEKRFSTCHKMGLRIKSLYFQACRHTKCSHEVSPFELVFGDPYIYEEMNGVKYRLGPEAFFQTNTLAAEQLYKVIFNACRASKSSTILDLCCGVGPVSLTFASHVKKCIGIDQSEQAIADAKSNAEINGIENVEFHAGKCRNILPNVLNDIYAEELIAVVNPGRAGLDTGVLNILRQCKYLKKIVYVSCNPESAVDNFITLCQPAKKKSELGVPFFPMRAVPVDLFPQTSHCELLVLFQRL